MISQINNATANSAGMEILDSTKPTFIVTESSKKICEANEAAIIGHTNANIIGKKLSELIHIIPDAGANLTPAYFNNKWFILEQETLLWNGSQHLKICLEPREGVPDFEVMQSLNNMIGFLLHRVRSPLTGIQGYAELLEANSDIDESSQYLGKIYDGVDELFELLDELDALQEISLNHVDLNNFSASPSNIVSDIVDTYPGEVKQNINYVQNDHTNSLRCNPGDLQRILQLLIENAVEYAPAPDHEITISRPSANSIKIAHSGNTIPESICGQLFYPFVTSRARKIGIGLTMAILFAKRYKGSIFVTENNPFRETSFLFCLPPE